MHEYDFAKLGLFVNKIDEWGGSRIASSLGRRSLQRLRVPWLGSAFCLWGAMERRPSRSTRSSLAATGVPRLGSASACGGLWRDTPIGGGLFAAGGWATSLAQRGAISKEEVYKSKLGNLMSTGCVAVIDWLLSWQAVDRRFCWRVVQVRGCWCLRAGPLCAKCPWQPLGWRCAEGACSGCGGCVCSPEERPSESAAAAGGREAEEVSRPDWKRDAFQ